MTEKIADLITKLEALDAALGDTRDQPTERAQEEHRRKKIEIARVRSGLRNERDDLDKPEGLLADIEMRRAFVLEKRAGIEQQIVDAPDWRTIPDGRERDKEYDRQQHLKRALQRLHEGTLLGAPGAVYERLADLDARRDELTARLALIRARHAAFVEEAEALLAEAVTS